MKEAIHADRIVILKEGRVLKEGTAREILSDKETLNASNLELLLPLKLLHKMDEDHRDHPTLRDHLWRLSLNK
jgi:energy-coupling factor transport system ATP-binding protein